jgi:hypothetical protein
MASLQSLPYDVAVFLGNISFLLDNLGDETPEGLEEYNGILFPPYRVSPLRYSRPFPLTNCISFVEIPVLCRVQRYSFWKVAFASQNGEGARLGLLSFQAQGSAFGR